MQACRERERVNERGSGSGGGDRVWPLRGAAELCCEMMNSSSLEKYVAG